MSPTASDLRKSILGAQFQGAAHRDWTETLRCSCDHIAASDRTARLVWRLVWVLRSAFWPLSFCVHCRRIAVHHDHHWRPLEQESLHSSCDVVVYHLQLQAWSCSAWPRCCCSSSARPLFWLHLATSLWHRPLFSHSCPLSLRLVVFLCLRLVFWCLSRPCPPFQWAIYLLHLIIIIIKINFDTIRFVITSLNIK